MEKFGTVMLVVDVVRLFMEVSTKPQPDLNRTAAAATFKIAVMLDFGVIGIQVMVLSWWLVVEGQAVAELIMELGSLRRIQQDLAEHYPIMILENMQITFLLQITLLICGYDSEYSLNSSIQN